MKKPVGKLAAWLGISALAIVGLVAIVSFAPPPTGTTPAAAVQSFNQTNTVAPQASVTPPPSIPAPTLSNNNYYTNVDGNSVHSPAYSSNGAVPDGATAQCRDGTYSFSQHRSGTCSHHGGVSQSLQ